MSIKKKILSVVMPCLLLLLGAAEGLAGDAMNPTSDHILRLHILAAGNTPEQQVVKYRLRDLLLSELAQAPELTRKPELTSSKGTEQFLTRELPRILADAREVLRQVGLHEEISYSFGSFPFPTRSYAGVTYPRGTYRALRIVIGSGAGRNWWCLLFPPLCLQSAAKASTEPDEQTATTEAEAICEPAAGSQIEIRFFLIDWLRQLFSQDASQPAAADY